MTCNLGVIFPQHSVNRVVVKSLDLGPISMYSFTMGIKWKISNIMDKTKDITVVKALSTEIWFVWFKSQHCHSQENLGKFTRSLGALVSHLYNGTIPAMAQSCSEDSEMIT